MALAFSAVAFGRELRVTTGTDLGRCAAGIALIAGPDAGAVSAPGDTCVLLPGNYAPGANITVTLQNLTIRSSNGPTATVVDLNNSALQIMRDGVTIGGPKADQGITFFNGNFAGAIQIGPLGTPPGQADENITIQYNIIRNNNGPGIVVLPPTSVELFKIFHNTIRDNLGAGIAFLNNGSVGRRGVDRNVVIEENFFENNFSDNILFGNFGSVEQTAILNNEIYRAFAGSGIHFGNNSEVRDSLIVGNMIQFNNFLGILFNNGGRVDNMLIKDNTGATLDQGITRNLWGGIYFINPVTELRDVTIEGNNINSNQNAGNPFILGNGIFTWVPGDIEGLDLYDNNIRQNCSNGFLKLLGGDLVRSSFDSNKVFNNGFGIAAGCPVVGPSAGFIAINTTNNIQDNAFSGNEFRENSLTGVTLFTTTGDISRLTFTNDKFIKNSIRGLSIFAAATGDIADLTVSGAEVLENQAGPGTGADIRTWTGDMETFTFSNSKFENNGGFGLRVISLGAPPNRGDIDLVTISNSQFNFNGTRAPVGLGSGAFLAAESIRRVEVSNTRATNNNDHGFSTTASRDLSELKFTDGEFSNNDRNVDTIGNGIDVSVNEAADNILVSGSKINSNNSGVKITAQDRIGRNITIEKNPEINDNRDAGVDLFSGRDLADVKVQENSLLRNAIGIRVDVHDRGSNISFTKNDIYGKDGVGIGVLLNSTGVTISDCNKIRRNATGIEVRKVR
ncbi:MAG: right-handed parallel beta-helix repeat-containing protein, partial [Candidatus Bipolaricaulia bacterium]